MTRATETPEAALRGATSLEERMRALATRPCGLTVAELIDRYMREYAGRDTSRAQRIGVWRELLGTYTLDALDSDLLHAARAEIATQPAVTFKGLDVAGRKIFKAKRGAGRKSSATLNRYVQAIAAVFTFAIDERLAPRGWAHPCRGIRRIQEPEGRVRFLDADERTRLFAACRASRYPRLYALVLMAMLTGARRGELLGLRWRDLDLDAGLARLGRTKNGERRTLVLLPRVLEALRPFADGDAARYVFGSVRERYQRPAQTDSAWRDAVARAEIRDMRFHDLRHCCASYMAQAGVPINVIAEVLGHRKLDVTRRYAHLNTQSKAQAMAGALGEIS